MLHLTSHPEWHALFETLGYAVGFLLYGRARRNSGDFLPDGQRIRVIAAATCGALVGSRALDLLNELPRYQISWSQVFLPTGGKTIVGGLLGGWLAVEIFKKFQGIETRTGDLFAIPLCIGIAVGRFGCLLTGLAEDTYGSQTALPWGVDFGDGVARHPTQAYEIIFLCLLAFILSRWQSRPHVEGILFRVFMVAYLGWRLLIDFLKPSPLLLGISFIQWCCAAGLLISFATWPLPNENVRLQTARQN